MGKGLEGRISVVRCLNGVFRVACGRVGSGGKATVSEISGGMVGGGEFIGTDNKRCSEVIEEEVSRLPYRWWAHLRALSRASPLNGSKPAVRSFWILA